MFTWSNDVCCRTPSHWSPLVAGGPLETKRVPRWPCLCFRLILISFSFSTNPPHHTGRKTWTTKGEQASKHTMATRKKEDEGTEKEQEKQAPSKGEDDAEGSCCWWCGTGGG